MKQGKASRDVAESHKVEPAAHAVTPARSTQYGASAAYKKDTMYVGRGYEAPKNPSQTTHKGGSQGRY